MSQLHKRASDIEVYSRVTFWALLLGGFTAIVYERFNWNCPMKTIGLACPGCGCGNAAKMLFEMDPIQALYVEPTAVLFLVSLSVLAFARNIKTLYETELARKLVFFSPLGLGFGNLIFQLSAR